LNPWKQNAADRSGMLATGYKGRVLTLFILYTPPTNLVCNDKIKSVARKGKVLSKHEMPAPFLTPSPSTRIRGIGVV
jgi:hypothetical protein